MDSIACRHSYLRAAFDRAALKSDLVKPAKNRVRRPFGMTFSRKGNARVAMAA